MAKSNVITIPEIRLERHCLYLIGTAPLIAHAFPEKQRKAMIDKQMKTAKGGRDARDPVAEFEASRYRLPDGTDGLPAAALKNSAVTACTSLSDVTKVAARQAFRVESQPMKSQGTIPDSFVRTALVPLVAHPPMMREDVVRLSGPSRSAEMRYRPEYPIWGVQLSVMLNPQVVSFGHLFTMFQAAGHGVGVGDYRPERNGDCGTFDVASEDEWKSWLKSAKLEAA